MKLHCKMARIEKLGNVLHYVHYFEFTAIDTSYSVAHNCMYYNK